MANHYAPPRAAVADISAVGGTISAEMVESLRRTKPWVLLIGVLLFVAAGFTVLGGVSMMFGSAMLAQGFGGDASATGFFIGMGVVYLVLALVNVFLALYLVKYSSAIGRLVAGGQAGDLEDALEHQRKFWRLAGGLAAIMLAVMALAVLAAIAIPTLRAVSAS